MKGQFAYAGLLLLVLAVTAAAMGQASQPASAPATLSVPKDLPDAWLGELALKKLADAARTGQYKPLQEQLTGALLGRLAAAGTPNLDAFNDAVYVLNACEFLPAAEPLPDGRAFAQWLVANRPLARLLFRTLAYDRPKADAIKALHALWKADPKVVLDYANLAVAFSTASAQLTGLGTLVEPATPTQAFSWYVKNCRQARFDLRSMPFELSRYLACSPLSLAERNWAQANYAKENSSDRLYNALKYDMDVVTKGSPKKITALAFTLPNLLKVGGVCAERAYFSAEVYRALAVPAVMIHGVGASGVGHAWLGYLRKTPDGKSVTWDTSTGRYSGDRFFVGELFDPVRNEVINDCELSVSLAAMLLPLRQREHAATALQLARLADGFAGAAGAADAPAGALAALAGEYNALPAAGATTQPAATARTGPDINLQALAPARRIDAAVTESLLTQALNENMALNGAWDFAIELGQKNRLSVERVGRLVNILLQRTAVEYPDYGCSRALRLIETFSDSAQKADLYERAAKIFAHRPDLTGRCLVAAGNAFLAAGKEAPAMSCFDHAAAATQNKAPGVLMEAMAAMEALYRKANNLKTAIALYQHYYQASHPIDQKSPFRGSCERYRLGTRLVDLLREANLNDAATKLVYQLDPPSKDSAPKKP